MANGTASKAPKKLPYRKEWLAITPAMAAEFLKNLHPDQRHERGTKVEQYSQDMVKGHWREDTEDTILFDWYGYLIDGQNRLLAVKESKTTVHFWVAWGVDPEVMAVKDTGAARSPSDSLRIKGLGAGMSATELRIVAAIARREMHWESGRHSSGSMKSVATATHSDIAEVLMRQPDIYGAAKIGQDASKSTRPPLVNANIYGFFWLHANRVDSDAAYRWQSFWLTPEDLPGGSPIAAVRERFFRSSLASAGRSLGNNPRADVLNTDEQLALLIRAWNLFIAERPANRQRMHIARGKLTNENFPAFLTVEEAEALEARAEKEAARAAQGSVDRPAFSQTALPA